MSCCKHTIKEARATPPSNAARAVVLIARALPGLPGVFAAREAVPAEQAVGIDVVVDTNVGPVFLRVKNNPGTHPKLIRVVASVDDLVYSRRLQTTIKARLCELETIRSLK